VFTGLDRGLEGEIEQEYQRSLPVEEALADDLLLAYEMNGEPLPPQHGFPLRLVVPGWYGMTNVKWLCRIAAVAEPFGGYQQSHGYRFRQEEDEDGMPVTRMMPRALMVPPGIPEFLSRNRYVPFGVTLLQGRAWSGWGGIVRVEVSADGGQSWDDAELQDQPSSIAWREWSYRWQPPSAGDYELSVRATDSAGRVQPDEPSWNVGGYANNAVQRIPVTVQAPSE
jgi:sulfane dehydrogenase subunit SoxC